jgi:hypothetical protein
MRRSLTGSILVALALLAVGEFSAGPLAAPATPAARITYTASGGIAGISDRLVISARGRAVLTVSRGPRTYRRTLSHAAHQRLLRLVTAARLPQLRARYAPATRVADGIDHALTFRGRTVAVLQGASVPKALSRALAALAELASSLQR